MRAFTTLLCLLILAPLSGAGCVEGCGPWEDDDRSADAGHAADAGKEDGGAATDAGGATVPLRILALNDLHGRLEAEDGPGGVARLATLVEELRAEQPNTLLLTSGDMVGASAPVSGLLHDEPTVAVMSALGVDAAGVGNHEFDRPFAELLRLFDGGCHPDGCVLGDSWSGAAFPLLGANVIDVASGEPALPELTIVEVGGLSVGIIGLTVQVTAGIVFAPFVEGLSFADEAATVNQLVPQLQAQGVETIVVLAHLGGSAFGLFGDCDFPSGRVFQMVEALDPAVDVVISGHTHSTIACAHQGVLVTQAGDHGRLLTVIDLELDPATGDVVESRAENREVTQQLPEHPDLRALVDAYAAEAAPLIERVVGSITGDITQGTDAAHQSVAGFLVADAFLAATVDDGAVAAFTNSAGLRGNLLYAASAGEAEDGQVRFGELYSMIPFTNMLVTLDLTGAQLEQWLEDHLAVGRPNWAQPSRGFQYTWQPSAPEGEQIDPADILIDGQPIALDASYRIAVNSFMASGPLGYEVLAEGTDQTWWEVDTAVVERYFEASSPVDPPALDRILRR